jgi:hypothetical protein
VIAQRDIIIDEEKRRFDEQGRQLQKLRTQYEELQKQKQHREETLLKDVNNLVL